MTEFVCPGCGKPADVVQRDNISWLIADDVTIDGSLGGPGLFAAWHTRCRRLPAIHSQYPVVDEVARRALSVAEAATMAKAASDCAQRRRAEVVEREAQRSEQYD